jgi:calcineurin-like phosphoesterase family protein
MRKFFISDLHFGDDRFNIFFRPFKTVEEQNETIVANWNSVVKPEDTVYVVGDFTTKDEGVKYVDRLNGKKILVIGNYDEPRIELLKQKFDEVVSDCVVNIGGKDIFVNHYPSVAVSNKFNIVGHIHSLWKVQRNMINVSVEAWNYTPVSEEQLIVCMNAIEKHYDVNVFAGELYANKLFRTIYTGDPIELIEPSLFLAGPTPRDANTPSWRPGFIEELRDAGFRGTIMSPEHKVFVDNYDYDKQVEWENEGLTKADLIVFWIPRDLDKMPGFTTNIEFGDWMKSGKCVLGYPVGTPKMNYLFYKAQKYNMPVFYTIKDVCKHIVSKFNKDIV